MQFLPADDTQTYAQSAQNLFADYIQSPAASAKARTGKGTNTGSGLDFAALLGADSASGEGSKLAVFNSENTPGIAPGISSVKDDRGQLKSRDLNFLEAQMRKNGLAEEVLQPFMAGLFGMNSQQMPVVSQIMGATRNIGREGEAFTEQERIAFSTLMQRAGFNSSEITELEELSFNGKSVKVLHQIQQRLDAGEKDRSSLMHMTHEEAAALTKALNLSSASSKEIMGKFGQESELRMNSDGFKTLFAAAGVELEREAANLAKLREIAPQAIRDMLQNARQAERIAPVSDNRGNRRTERSEILMRDTLSQLDEDDENKTQAQKRSILAELGNHDSKSGKADKAQLNQARDDEAMAAETAEKYADPRGLRRAGSAERDLAQQGREFGQPGSNNNTGENLGRNAANSSRSGDSVSGSDLTASGREALAAKLENTAGAIFSLQVPGSENSSAATRNTRAAIYHDRIFDQVEHGIMRNAINGSRQITLRLDPPDLGRLTLNLTVHNGEVKALIRTEQSEVTQVVSEQLAQIKASLEEQGLKVAELEVETRAQSHAGTDNWSSAEQHNQQQQMEARAEFVRLARSRAKEGEALAQTMQNSNQPATISEAGLHLVA